MKRRGPIKAGETWTRWTVLCDQYQRPRTTAYQVDCRCVCGKEKTVKCGDLRSGKSKSCGCLSREMTAERHRVAVESGRASYIEPTPANCCGECFGLPWRRPQGRRCRCGETYAPEYRPTIVERMQLPHRNRRVA